jgi:hypothetical protein
MAWNVPTEVLFYLPCSPFHIRADHGKHLFQSGRFRGNNLAHSSYMFVMRKCLNPWPVCRIVPTRDEVARSRLPVKRIFSALTILNALSHR